MRLLEKKLPVKPKRSDSIILPALLIVILCCTALWTSQELINTNKKLNILYRTAHEGFIETQAGYSDIALENELLKANKRKAKEQGQWLYFLIASLGMICFLLVISNYRGANSLVQSDDDLERANRLLQSRLAAMELTLDGIFIVGKGGNLRYMNKSLMELNEIEAHQADDYIGKDWIELYSTETQGDIQSKATEALYEENQWCGNVIVGKDNKKIELTLTKLPDGGLIGTCRDMSGQEEAEEQRQELESQFYQAQKMEAIGRLAGGIAHDFNNILAAINGYAEFLVEDLTDRPDEKKFANKILLAAHQARKLVDQILTFSRRNDTKTEGVDLLSLIDENVSMLKAASLEVATIESEINLNKAFVHGNSTQISQVVMNLCVNALDAMEGKKGVLNISLNTADFKLPVSMGMMRNILAAADETPPTRTEEFGVERTVMASGTLCETLPYICMKVSDDGTGMSRVIMDHIFEPFFTTKPVDKGTGLGLATVHGVMAQHQGAIIIDSTLGKGTTFHLFFPSIDESAVDATSSDDKMIKEGFEGVRILLVEDQESVREMTAKMLVRMGFDVAEEENGLTALNMLKEQSEETMPHLVLTDQSMPQMTGLELVAEAHENFPELPFVLLSGYSQEKLQDIMDDYESIKAVIRKPISKETLRHQLNLALAGVVV